MLTTKGANMFAYEDENVLFTITKWFPLSECPKNLKRKAKITSCFKNFFK